MNQCLCSYPDFEIWVRPSGQMFAFNCETKTKESVKEVKRINFPDYDDLDTPTLIGACNDYDYCGELDDFTAYCYWKVK